MAFPRFGWLVFLSLFLCCQAYKKPGAVEVRGAGEGSILYALSKGAAAGIIVPAKPERLSYSLEPPAAGTALMVEYRFSDGEPLSSTLLQELAAQYYLVLDIEGEGAWALPWEASFLGVPDISEQSAVADICFTVPLKDGLENFSVYLETIDGGASAGIKGSDISFELRSLELTDRWYGFTAGGPGEGGFSATPFVSVRAGERQVIMVDPPEEYRLVSNLDLYISPGDGPVIIEAGGIRYDYRPDRNALFPPVLYIPAGALGTPSFPLTVTGDITSLEAVPVKNRPFPEDAILADPELILHYRQELWRDPRYELFQWDSFPSILIFDTADYATQSRLFKRLAFFTEKRDFRGRLAADAEIAGLHGWNAHDYRAEDLAGFFETARATDFPLLREERELESILVGAGILLKENDVITAGKGAVVSISRESADYLRSLFMVHEAFHGLFFIDEDFRNFTRRRWERFPRTAKQFIISYFDSQRYDPDDDFLMMNEFMAYCLQQPVSSAADYFGKTLAARIDANSWRRRVLPPKDETAGNWPELAAAFSAEVEAFSDYVNRRWGLAAGRVRRISVRKL
jgi:hypothetical protein